MPATLPTVLIGPAPLLALAPFELGAFAPVFELALFGCAAFFAAFGFADFALDFGFVDGFARFGADRFFALGLVWV
ncbi:MAG TPA: hypothetical protein VFS64_02645 [Solirubrobacterales bacterium]|nr:hypothetical protein [Solirubrobacterales bacterium]